MQFGLWAATSNGRLLFPSPTSDLIGDVSLFHFMGTVLGKAVYESVLVREQAQPQACSAERVPPAWSHAWS